MFVLILLKFLDSLLLQGTVVPAKLTFSLEVELALEEANNFEEGKRFLREVFFFGF